MNEKYTMIMQRSELEMSGLLICIEFIVASILISIYWWRRDKRECERQRQIDRSTTLLYSKTEEQVGEADTQSTIEIRRHQPFDGRRR